MVELNAHVLPQTYDVVCEEPLISFFDLKRFSDETGSFTEIMRLTRGHFNTANSSVTCFNVNQINFSEIAPQAIKAFHVHRTQTDLIYIPPFCKIKLVVGDVQVDCNYGQFETYILGDCKSQLVKIPPGIAHGFQNLLNTSGLILYFVDVNFTPIVSDKSFQEYRLPSDYFGASIWDIPTD